MWISDYLAALSLTMVIEVAVAALWGYRSYFAIRTVILANLMSHPLLTYLLWVNQYFRILDFRASVAILEILVVFLEWGCFVFVLRVNPRKLFMLSSAMNLASFVIGMMVFPF